tara:strand:+ start:16638 stop:17252 length:615 start_codon:yes stop_codon:yes gene_type:complete
MQASFNELLKNSLENSDSDDDNEEICLISHEPLSSNHIKLSCSHKFNYKHIYKEVTQQKSGKNHLEVQKLKKFQFKCPYCRNIENGVLSWNSNFPQVIGINWPPSQFIKPNFCKYAFKSGKKKGMLCNRKCVNDYCTSHEKIMVNRLQKASNNKLKCKAITKKGTPCSRIAKSSNGNYCLQHFKSIESNKVCIQIPTENVVITI